MKEQLQLVTEPTQNINCRREHSRDPQKALMCARHPSAHGCSGARWLTGAKTTSQGIVSFSNS